MNACGNEACDMRHIYHKVCANLLCDRGEFLKIDDPRICGSACKDELRLALKGESSYLLVVYDVLGLGNTLGCIGSIGVAVVIYAISVLLLKTLVKNDILMLPKGEKLAEILEKFKLIV